MNSVSQKPCSWIGTSPCTKCLRVWRERIRAIRLAAYCNYLSKILWIQLQISIQNYWEIETLLCIDHPITFICPNWENSRNLIDVDISGDYQLSKVLWLEEERSSKVSVAMRAQWHTNGWKRCLEGGGHHRL